MNSRNPIILFDDQCILCSATVNFIIKHDPELIFSFASLNGETGTAIRKEFNLFNSEPESFILLMDNTIYQQSTAALKIAQKLKGPIRYGYRFIHTPAFIRDGLYKFIAKNRYRIFGRSQICYLPNEENKKRFLP